MNDGKSASFRTTLTRTVLWVVATVVASSVAIREVIGAHENDAAEAATATAVCRIITGTSGLESVGDASASPAAAERWCNRLVSQPYILGAWMYDARGELLSSATQSDGIDAAISGLAIRKGVCRSVQLPSRAGESAASARLVDAEVESSRSSDTEDGGSRVMRLLVRLPREKEPWYQRLWLYGTPLLAVGAAGSAVGLWRLHRRVLDPLERLSHLVDDLTSHSSAALASHPNEIGQIVRALNSLRAERNQWRERAEQSARAVHVQVAKQTEAIYRDLRRAQREIYTDPLTGLNNRRVLKDRFAEIFQAQSDAKQDMSVVMFDIDHFKTLNDTQGHLSGDDLLRFTAELIRGALRESDIAIRYGGDEFIVLLPAVSIDEAEAIAKRVVALFGQRASLLTNLPRRPGLSAGVASIWRQRPTTAEELLQMADRALYDAKEAGRQAVRLYQGKLPPAGAGAWELAAQQRPLLSAGA